MRKRTQNKSALQLYGNARETADRFGLGLQTAIALARKAGAERKVGGRNIYDFRKIDEFLERNNKVALKD